MRQAKPIFVAAFLSRAEVDAAVAKHLTPRRRVEIERIVLRPEHGPPIDPGVEISVWTVVIRPRPRKRVTRPSST